MELAFRRAAPEELSALCRLYEDVASDMRKRGLAQWEWGAYPSRDTLLADLQHGGLYRADEGGRLVGAFALRPVQEEAYAYLSWRFGVKPATLYRLALRPDESGRGLGARMLAFAREEAARLGYDSLRLDTSSRNERALKLFRAGMARRAGSVRFDDPDQTFECFETPLAPDCPLLPIPMRPAYRYGDATPWGGDGLKTIFGKPIPDPRTGEAFEVSAIPGLESADDTGETLSALIARHGERLTGLPAGSDFPLLLKLICARDALSVQVHPGDSYAAAQEGKPGKNEAWVILHAGDGACIRYGMAPGATREALLAALETGGDVASLIAQTPVAAGDVFYIPSGLVHAIGGGVTLYEIQQASDVTYRLWDYDRRNGRGEKRPLHIRQAMDVLDLGLAGERGALPDAKDVGVHPILRVPAFALDCCCVNGLCELSPAPGCLRMLTALNALLLQWEGDALEIEAGETVLLPAACPPVVLNGVGRCLVGWAEDMNAQVLKERIAEARSTPIEESEDFDW